MVGLYRFVPMLTVFASLVLARAGLADEAAAIQTVEKLGGKVFVDKRTSKSVYSVTFYGDNKSIDAALKAVGSSRNWTCSLSSTTWTSQKPA